MEIVHEQSRTEMVFYKSVWHRGVTAFHWHERIELVMPLEHPIGVLIDGIWYEAKAGDIIVIGEEKIHAFRMEHEDVPFLLGQFPYRILLGSGNEPGALLPLITAEEITKTPELSKTIDSLLGMMVAEGRVAEGEKNPVLRSLIISLYYLLLRHFPAPREGKSEKKEKGEFYRIVSYVDEHYTENITVGSIARELYIDRGKLSRLFLTYAGMPLNVYINSLRIDRASALILGGMPITEAALDAGFQSVRTFHEVFRRMKGTSPRELKK